MVTLAAEQRLLQIRLYGLVADPDPAEGAVERLAGDRAFVLSIPAYLRRAVDEVEGDDVLFLDFLERLHDAKELIRLRLDRGQLGGGIGLGETVVQCIGQLVGRERAQQVQLNPARALREHARGVRGFLRHIQACHIDFENSAGADAGTVEYQLLPAKRNLVIELDATDFGGTEDGRECQRNDRDREFVDHLSASMPQRKASRSVPAEAPILLTAAALGHGPASAGSVDSPRRIPASRGPCSRARAATARDRNVHDST